MRTYYSHTHRVGSDGSIEVEGRWAGLTWLAIGLLALVPLIGRAPIALGVLGAAGVYLFAFPPRRRVTFDAGKRRIRIEHAGVFAERGRRTIAFDEVREIGSEPAGKRHGRAVRRLTVRTDHGSTYLFTHNDSPDLVALEKGIRVLFG